MILILSVLVSVILIAVAIVHIFWGLKIWVPIKDEAQLAKAVAGFNGVKNMPKSGPCFVVSLCLVLTALLVLISSEVVDAPLNQKPFIQISSIGAAFVFLARGLFSYTQQWATIAPEQPFRKLDKRYYSPLCLFIGIAIISIVVSNL